MHRCSYWLWCAGYNTSASTASAKTGTNTTANDTNCADNPDDSGKTTNDSANDTCQTSSASNTQIWRYPESN